ncbi:MAG: nucleotidyltransferase substrate binding protein [Dethiobacter sp.]|nr:nucleotidyltransferase substrate binding protein [Dethiobacter sp.]MBS4054070.1 nucleotidyltransferase substrate binding protein [Thermaerobacter sp.]
MKLNLTSLTNAIASLQAGTRIVSEGAWFSEQSEDVQNTIIAGVIQNFEFAYEQSIKMMRRRLEMDAASPTEVDFADYRGLLRTAAEKGLVADVLAWFEYRSMRNITSHTYDHAKAMLVYQGAHKFLDDAKALLQELVARNV